VTVERVPGTPWPRVDRGVEAALRHHFLLCGHELTGAELTENRDPLERAILQVLQDTILPGIHRDGGDLRLLGIEDGVVQVSMDGACRTCPASSATLKLGVEKTLLAAFPGEVTRVEQV
jgi:Fe-S cluster biogenesis protein NfuA